MFSSPLLTTIRGSVIAVSLACVTAVSVLSSSDAVAKGNKTPSVIKDTQRVIRICTGDITLYKTSASQRIPSELKNARTSVALQNQKSVLSKTDAICGSVGYWIDIFREWRHNGTMPDRENAAITKRVLYTLKIQLKHLRKAYNELNRVLYEERERLDRAEQIEDIFVIRKRMMEAKRDLPPQPEILPAQNETKTFSYNRGHKQGRS